MFIFHASTSYKYKYRKYIWYLSNKYKNHYWLRI